MQRRWRSMLGWTCRLALLAKKINYEEPECGSAANFLLGVEIEGDPPGRMEVEAGGAQCRLTGGNATNSRGGREREVAALPHKVRLILV